METFDAIIVGGGIIGCSIAFELAGENLRILVLDRRQAGQEASWAAAGMLSPAPDSPRDIPLVQLSKESLRLYPKFIQEVEQRAGRSVGYVKKGTLQLFLGPLGETERDRLVADQRELALESEPIALNEIEAQEGLGPSVSAAALLPGEARVDPRLLMDALLVAIQRRNVEIRSHHTVQALLEDRGRCAGVIVDGQNIFAKQVVLAAGCFSGGILANSRALATRIPTRPVRGQMIALQTPPHLKLERVLRSHRGYIVPRSDGRVVAGSTIEEAGFDKRVTPAGVRQILDSVAQLCPKLAEGKILETWSGLRPGTPDDLPVLGPTEEPGLLVATGHYRNGILLAPVTAKLARGWIMGGEVEFDVAAFSPRRFIGRHMGPSM